MAHKDSFDGRRHFLKNISLLATTGIGGPSLSEGQLSNKGVHQKAGNRFTFLFRGFYYSWKQEPERKETGGCKKFVEGI